MSSSTNVTSMDVALQAIVALGLPDCESVEEGPCYMESTAGSGFVVYDEHYKSCFHSDITLPGFNLLPHWLLGVVYVVFMIYLFLGVAIASDIFMESVETITATTKTVKRKLPDGREVTEEVPVWNWAVANISLMAMGSSSPEIVLALLDCILELGKSDAQLGPSTIVGSGSYNLLVITAVCTVSITGGVYKRITELRVFVFTTIFQFWVHIWMLVVYQWWTPDYVTMAEALITLAQFPVLLVGAWLIDTQPWAKNKVAAEEEHHAGPVELTPNNSVATPRASAKLIQGDQSDSLKHAKPSEGMSLKEGMSIMDGVPLSSTKVGSMDRNTHNMMYKRRAARAMTGHMACGVRKSASTGRGRTDEAGEETATALMLANMSELPTSCQKVMFKSSAYSVLESTGVARVTVLRYDGDMTSVLRVHFTTTEDTAVGGLDFEPQQGVLVFESNDDAKTVYVKIVDDDLSEPDVTFWVQLTHVESEGDAMIVQDKVPVTIVDDDQNGILTFELPHYEANATEVVAKVIRRLGTDGMVSVNYHTVDGTATAGVEYEQSQGTLVFDVGQTEQTLRVPVLGFAADGVHKTFKILLENPEGGAELGKRTHCRVTIIKRNRQIEAIVLGSRPADKDIKEADKEGAERKEGGAPGGAEGEKKEEFNLMEAYRNQFKGAIAMPGGEEGENSDGLSLTLHYLCITWKLVFSVVPPPDWRGGYPCFVASLLVLAGTVFLLHETTQMMGCVFGLLPLVNGYSIVALGTSLPDTFACRIAAMNEDTADAAIGSVMGSNSVNVLIGLGLPWLVGAAYSMSKGVEYHQAGGDLFFSVLVFILVALGGVTTLSVCRRLGGELGGPSSVRITSFCIYFTLWFIFLILSSMRAYGDI